MKIEELEHVQKDQKLIKDKVTSAPTKIIHKMKLLRQKRLERDKKRRERTERIKRKGKKIKVYMDTGYDD